MAGERRDKTYGGCSVLGHALAVAVIFEAVGLAGVAVKIEHDRRILHVERANHI